MSKNCPKCRIGQLTFFDGSFLHNPYHNYHIPNREFDEEDFECGCKVAFSKDKSEGITIKFCNECKE